MSVATGELVLPEAPSQSSCLVLEEDSDVISAQWPTRQHGLAATPGGNRPQEVTVEESLWRSHPRGATEWKGEGRVLSLFATPSSARFVGRLCKLLLLFECTLQGTSPSWQQSGENSRDRPSERTRLSDYGS